MTSDTPTAVMMMMNDDDSDDDVDVIAAAAAAAPAAAPDLTCVLWTRAVLCVAVRAEDGQVWTCGCNDYGQTAQGSNADRYVLVPTPVQYVSLTSSCVCMCVL